MKQVSKILLPVSSTRNIEAAFTLGRNFIRRFNAHLAVIHIQADGRDIAPLAGEGLTGGMIEELMSAAAKESVKRSEEIKDAFQTFATTNGLEITDSASSFPTDRPTASLTVLTGDEPQRIAWHARLSDFTLIQHPDSGDEVSSSEALHAVLFDSGRPAIMAPRVPPKDVIRRICIAWNGSAEAASALRGVLAWASTAEKVRVLHGNDSYMQGPSVNEVVQYLAMHNIEADTQEFPPEDRNVGKGLLKACTDFDADLLAMGAYSHSRLRQLILGGVTRHILEHAELPVLLSH
ncbi:MAG: universal stress protein [Acetobacter sp.]|jgi:nucleotide-binding universal stress UspA family protein